MIQQTLSELFNLFADNFWELKLINWINLCSFFIDSLWEFSLVLHSIWRFFFFHSILVDFEVHQFHFSSIAFLNFKLRGNISKWYFKVTKVWEFKGFSRGFIAMCWIGFSRFNLHGKNLCVREFVKVSDFLIRIHLPCSRHLCVIVIFYYPLSGNKFIFCVRILVLINVNKWMWLWGFHCHIASLIIIQRNRLKS